MTAPLEITVTNAGRAAIVNAQNTGTAPVTITQIGLSGTAVAPLPTATALTGEFKRGASIAGEVVADDTIHVTLTDSTGDAYTLRSFGLYLADGTLFAIYGQAGPVLEKTAQSIAAMSIDVIFADIAAASITFGDATFTNPPATTTRQGVVELATVTEAQAGIDALRALTPSAAKAAILGWLLAQDGAGSGIDADLLDGQQGAYYIDIPARLGFNPLNAALYTAADVRGKLITVDGSGSGVDADLLDGEHGSYYRDLTNSTGTLPNGRLAGFYSGLTLETVPNSTWVAGGAYGLNLRNSDILGANGIFFSNDTSNLNEEGLNFLKSGAPAASQNSDDYDNLRGPGNGTLLWNGNVVWHGGNDGSGSGQDADLLDGQHGAYYRDLVNSTGILPNARFSGSYSGVTEIEMSRVRLTSTSDVSLTSTGHAFQVGADSSANIAADGNEIQARQNGAAANLNLNLGGGDVVIGPSQGTAWHSANDGAGSALDADLLDGYQGSAYDRIVSQSLVENGGYVTYASGRKECWGIVNITAEDTYYTVNLPVTHTDWVLPIGDGMALSSAAQENTAVRDIQYDGSGRPISFRIYNAAGPLGGFPFRWRSIGK